MNSLRSDLRDQTIANVLTITQQQQRSLDTFILNDRERLHSFAQYFSNSRSDNIEEIKDKLEAFKEVDAIYTVVNLDNGTYYSNLNRKTSRMKDEDLQEYLSFDESDARDPYQSLYADELRFGYYEKFVFADGVQGVFQKGYDCSEVSTEFSLSFYEGQGLGFVVTRQGDILLRSVDMSGQYSFNNIFDLVEGAGEDNEDIVSMFSSAVDAGETGTLVFEGKGESYICAYVPMHNVDRWAFVSVIPMSMVMQEADSIVMDTQSMLIVLIIIMAVFLVFVLTIWWVYKKMEKKDLEVEYRKVQFDVFSTYLSNNTDDIYLMLDPAAGKADYISPNVERILGVSEKQVMDDPDAIGTAVYISGGVIGFEKLSQMEDGETLEPMFTERINMRTKEPIYFRETVYCVFLQGKRKVIVYMSDRTKERKVEETLTEALNMAKVANAAKTAFLGSVSHDIRTPMNAIMGLVMLLREEADNPEHVLEYTQRIDAASQHLLGLINDVLDMNKIEGGNTTLNLEAMSLAEIVEELNTIIRPQAKAKNQEFDIFASSFTYEHLIGDKLRINQILINILSNAVKYTPAGGRIEMQVNELPQVMNDYSHIQFVIKDNGYGMSPDYLKVIFDPFTREQNLAKSKIQGTGLGMAITKSLVDLMGGTINVESEEGKGSVFTVELELKIQDLTEDREFWEKNGLRRMIVADDEEDVCKNVVKSMRNTGVTVHYATSGHELIEMMRAAREAGEPYDIILLDWKMPDLDGLETARLIREKYKEKIPILFFTTYDWHEIEQEAHELGIKHFLPKPFFIYSFKESVSKILGEEKSENASQMSDEIVKGLHILVVDDVEVNRMVLVKILSTMGANCDTAENGQEAVDKFVNSPRGTYDIIMMDVQMPVMGGYDATRTIRASSHPDAGSIPIIAMTANAFVDDVRDALAAGMDAHVSKPIILEQLKSKIHDVLSRKDSCKI